MSNIKIISLGEIIWDMLPGGAKLGGAPLNFAWHAHQLGAEVTIVSRVGRDELGEKAIQQLEKQGFSTKFIQQDEKAPTGQALVELSAEGSPKFTIVEQVAYDYIALDAQLLEQIQTADVIYFGTLAQRSEISQATMHQYLQAAPERSLNVLDINLRLPFFNEEIIRQSLRLANVLKLNDEELPVIAGYLGLVGEIKEQLATLAKLFDLKVIAYTRGAGGSLVYLEGEWSDYRPSPVNVVDTVGAGDAFTAAMVIGMIQGKDLDTINKYANQVAAYVCTQPGATPVLPRD